MRTITLGTELRRRGWSVSLYSHELEALPRRRAEQAGISVVSISANTGSELDVQNLGATQPDLVIVDGYDFSPAYFECLDDMGCTYVVIDDNGIVAPQGALLTVNPNPHADLSLYPKLESTKVLLGVRYAIVREEVLQLRDHTRSSRRDGRRSILVSIGGTDVKGLNYALAKSLSRDSSLDITASGASPPTGVTAAPADIAATIHEADLVVIGAGSTMWEAACVGTPSIALIVADNQIRGSRAAEQAGVSVVIDCRRGHNVDQLANQVRTVLENSQKLVTMSDEGRKLVDGLGVRRIVDAIESVLPS